MRKGCNEVVAAQRVMHAYGSSAPQHSSIRKVATDAQASFTDAAAEVYDAEGCSGAEALRKARLQNPALYKALMSVD
jgi:hypothetical protein